MSGTNTELRREIRNGVPVKLDADGRVVEFWIRRENWLRGKQGRRLPISMLLVGPGSPYPDYQGLMCCMGHCSLAIGHAPSDIENVCYYPPPPHRSDVLEQGAWMVGARNLAVINDCISTSDIEKEHDVVRHFSNLAEPITVHFCDGIPAEFADLGAPCPQN